MCGQLLRPAQETGVEKVKSMASHQQTPIQHSPELNMSNGNSLYGYDGANFSRLTEHLVFAFLGGYVSMDDLPCLGDLANGIGGFHRTTSISMNSYSESSQVESLGLNGNLHQLSTISMDLNFVSRIMEDLRKSVKTSECYQEPVESVSILLDSLDASLTACSPPEHTSQRTDEIESLPENSINAHFICNKFVKDILNLVHPTPSMPFQQCDFTGIFVLSTTDNRSHFDSLDSNNGPDILFENLAFKQHKINVNRTTEIQEVALTNHHHALTSGNLESQFHRHHKNLDDVPVSNLCPTRAWNNEPIHDGNTFAIPNPRTLMDYLYGDLEIPRFLDTESSSMQPEDLCFTIGNNGEGPTFSVPSPSQLMNFLYGNLESPVFLFSESIEELVHSISNYADRYSDGSSMGKLVSQSADHTNKESYQCSAMNSSAIPETVFGLMTKSLCDSSGFTNGMDFERVRNPSNSQSAEGSSEVSDSKLSYHQDDFSVVYHEPRGPFPKNPTNFFSTASLFLYKCEDDEENMTKDSSSFTSNTDESSLMDKNSVSNYCENPEVYASSPGCDQKVCNSSSSMFDHPCFLEDCGSDDDSEVADLSGCMHSGVFVSNENIFNILSMPVESENGSLFDENEITPASSISVECNGERISLDSSFFDLNDHDDNLEMYGLSNQDQYTDIGYKCESPSWPGKSEGQTQKSLTLIPNLNKDDTANETSTADSSLFHSNTDETSVMNKNWTDEIYERNSENSVSQCCFNHMNCDLETSLIDAGRMDCLPLLHLCNDGFGDSIEHQSLKNDENNLKMIFDQFHEGLSKDDNSIYKLPCSVELLGLSSFSFDISDHDEFLEWYGINDQDQFMDGDWTCDSPTWPRKM
ncbi:hypothetical protein CAEBREN_23093 [Caenorhabditis brenneri]|uniref:Uncharacterized protein n=1 Tax=Caenorhabditis brenneri TaxID=135651 RepID=G0NNM0_CAEBE|nr:hypothetical protein CAEBREN_23093 [Caenorhabditis brenneri]